MNEMGNWNKYPVLSKSDFKIIELHKQGKSIKEIEADNNVKIKDKAIYNKITQFKKEGYIK